MTVMVALLRGVNVGGRSKLAMADLRAVATTLGYRDVATYIQSGNLVLSTAASTATVADDLERALAAAGGVTPAVLVRTRSQLARVVADNPFLQRGEAQQHLHVVFCPRSPEGDLATLDLRSYQPEEAAAVGDELYLLLPGGVGRSKLATDLSRRRGTLGTMRNWRTVTKLLEMADDVDG